MVILDHIIKIKSYQSSYFMRLNGIYMFFIKIKAWIEVVVKAKVGRKIKSSLPDISSDFLSSAKKENMFEISFGCKKGKSFMIHCNFVESF